MDFAEQLRVLQNARGEPAKLALATVDLAFPELPDAERSALEETLEAAAIPHWCDPGILAVLLDIRPKQSRVRFGRLRKLTVVEPFPARGEIAVNVHEAARLALRKWVAADRPDSFRVLSQRAAGHFAADRSPAGRVEWTYHRLCSAPDEAATELERLDREWSSSARPEDCQALAIALRELEETGLVRGRAQVWVLLNISWARVSRGESAKLRSIAKKILDLARNVHDERAEADAQCLIGDVFEAQGRLEAAQSAFEEYLAISRRLVEQDPTNAGWQRGLAVALWWRATHSRNSGRLEEAVGLFREAWNILDDLLRRAPGSVQWERERQKIAAQLADMELHIQQGG